jgi:hypothetical protein
MVLRRVLRTGILRPLYLCGCGRAKSAEERLEKVGGTELG